MLYGFASAQHGGVKLIILTNLYRAIAAVGRCEQAQPAALLRFREILLVIHGLQALILRKHPNLIEMYGLGFGRVELAMRHAGARAHVLDVARLDHRPVAHTVAMLERTLEHVGDNFHIAMRVHGKTTAAGDAIVVHHAQSAELHVLGVVVISESKRKMRVEPAVIGVAAFVALTDLDHDVLFREAVATRWRAAAASTTQAEACGTARIILVITTIVKRRICLDTFRARRAPIPLDSRNLLPFTSLFVPFPPTALWV